MLMRLHDASGDGARALRVYHECATTLQRELGTAPSAATREVYEALLRSTAEPASPEPGSAIAGRRATGRPARPAIAARRAVARCRPGCRTARAGDGRARRRQDPPRRRIAFLVRTQWRAERRSARLSRGRRDGIRHGRRLAALGADRRAPPPPRPDAPHRARATASRAPVGDARPPRARATARERAPPAAVRRSRARDPAHRRTAAARRRRPPVVRRPEPPVPPLPAARRARGAPARSRDRAPRGHGRPPPRERAGRRAAGARPEHGDRARTAHPRADEPPRRAHGRPAADRVRGRTALRRQRGQPPLRGGGTPRRPRRRDETRRAGRARRCRRCSPHGSRS